MTTVLVAGPAGAGGARLASRLGATKTLRGVTGAGRVSVMNALGVQVLGALPRPLQQAGGAINFDLSSLPAGIYFVRVGRATLSVVKQ